MVKSDYEPRLLTQYRTELVSMLAEKLGRKNILSLPRLQKIVVNMGVGAATAEKKYLDEAVDALTQITGQKAMSEQLVFPELNPDKINRVQGMTINLVTSASKDDEARELLRGFGMPFKSEDSKKP